MIPATMSRKMDLAKRGSSSHVCPQCQDHLTLTQQQELFDRKYIRHSCGNVIFEKETLLTVRPDYHRWMDLSLCRSEKIWYHATDLDPWLSPSTPEFYAHVGSRETALDRAKVCGYTHLYTVAVSPDAQWSSYLLEDQNYWPEVPGEETGSERQVLSDVTRYVIRYEDPGAICLIVKSSALTVVSKEGLT